MLRYSSLPIRAQRLISMAIAMKRSYSWLPDQQKTMLEILEYRYGLNVDQIREVWNDYVEMYARMLARRRRYD